MVSYTAHCVTGDYEYYSYVMVDKRLPGCEYGQCGLLLEAGCTRLVSYDVVVAEVDAEGWVKVFACPSRSTANHLAKWGRPMGMSYRLLIDLLYRRLEMNYHTGLQRPITFNPNEPLLNVGRVINTD